VTEAPANTSAADTNSGGDQDNGDESAPE